MSDNGANLELVVKARDEAQGVLDKIKGGIGDLAKTAAGFAIGQGLAKLPDFFMSAAQAAADDEASTLRVIQAFKNAGASADEYGDNLREMIKTGQALGFSDDNTRDSLSLLVAATGDAEEAYKRYKLAMDLARGTGMDVVQASKLLGKVTDDNVNVLKRYGVTVEKGSTETDLFAAVFEKFHGQAQTFADSTAGKMARFKDQMGELKESIGYAVLPVMTTGADLALKFGGALSDVVGNAVDKIKANVGPAFRLFKDAVTGNFMDAHEAFLALPDDLQKYGQTIWDVGSKIRQALPGIKQAALDVFDTIKTKLGDVRDYLAKTWQELANDPQVKEAFGHIQDAVKAAVDFISQHWPEIKAVIGEVIDNAKTRIEGLIQSFKGIVEVLSGVINLVSDLFHGRWSEVWDDLKQIASGALDLVIGNIKTQFGNIPEIILNLAGDAANAAEKFASGIVDGIMNLLESLPDKMGALAKRAASSFLDNIKVAGISAGDIAHIIGSIPKSFATGGYVPTPTLAVVGDAPGGEWVLNQSQMAGLLSSRGGGSGDGLHIHLEGATIYGWSDFKSKVGQAVREIKNGGGGV